VPPPNADDDVARSSKKTGLADCGEDEKLVEMVVSARKKSFTGLKAGESMAWGPSGGWRMHALQGDLIAS
jgi:hypothetical protein